MKHWLIVIFFASTLLNQALADEPIINYNVHVMTNSSPSQCTSSWSGNAGQQGIIDESGYGMDTGTAVSIQSCVGCAFDNASGDCICKTCYVHY